MAEIEKVECKGCGIDYSRLRGHLKNNDKCSAFYNEGELDQYLRDKKKIQNRAQYEKKRDEVKQKKMELYQKDPEKFNQRNRDNYQKHSEKIRDQKAQYYADNRDDILSAARDRRNEKMTLRVKVKRVGAGQGEKNPEPRAVQEEGPVGGKDGGEEDSV